MAELNGEPVGPDALQALALTNYGHFTSMRVEQGRVRGLSLHLDRLVRDCRAVFDTDLDPERVLEFVRRAAPRTGSRVVRVTVFDPALDLGRIGSDAHPHVLVTTRGAGSLPLPPLRIRSAAYTRDMPGVKGVGLFGSLRHRRAAQRAGFDDALFVDGRSMISEGGTWNIGFVRGGQVVWPDAECLAGITMRLLQRIHVSVLAPVGLADVTGFDAAFATNAAIGVRAIGRLDDLPLPDTHPLIEELRRQYTRIPGDPL
ncbi:aminotransferase class IV family protein [Streptomyces verrucosisporus]|uniref:aminotransferase class IV family protein n=1 Tax=Streptomyces verrucosisporus TaxID=1695161 RepID=UPI0019D229E6|nr:aminotransferase class IV family protein [Streptomyces verrucosisporus]MBN3928700.1 aminotransferase class IV family protein [Streptomyces verrucosisporus]